MTAFSLLFYSWAAEVEWTLFAMVIAHATWSMSSAGWYISVDVFLTCWPWPPLGHNEQIIQKSCTSA